MTKEEITMVEEKMDAFENILGEPLMTDISEYIGQSMDVLDYEDETDEFWDNLNNDAYEYAIKTSPYFEDKHKTLLKELKEYVNFDVEQAKIFYRENN